MHHDDSADLVLLSRPVQRRRGRVLDAGRRPGDSRKFPPAAQRPGSHWRGKWQKECSACAEKRGKRGKAHRLRPAGVHPAGSPVTPVAKPLPRHSGSSDDLFGRCVGGRKRMPVQRGNMGGPAARPGAGIAGTGRTSRGRWIPRGERRPPRPHPRWFARYHRVGGPCQGFQEVCRVGRPSRRAPRGKSWLPAFDSPLHPPGYS